MHGDNEFTLGVAARLNDTTVLRFIHKVSALIAEKLKDRWIRCCIRSHTIQINLTSEAPSIQVLRARGGHNSLQTLERVTRCKRPRARAGSLPAASIRASMFFAWCPI